MEVSQSESPKGFTQVAKTDVQVATTEVFVDESANFPTLSRPDSRVASHNFAFVNLTPSVTSQDGDARRLVRQQANQSAWQRRRLHEDQQWPTQTSILPMPTSMAAQIYREPKIVFQGQAQPNLQSAPDSVMIGATELPSTHLHTQEPELNQGNVMSESQSSTREVGFRHHTHENISPSHLGLPPQSYSQADPALVDSQLAYSGSSIHPTSPSHGRIDPFNVAPALVYGRIQALMHHYTQVLVKSMLAVAVDPEDKWFGYSMTDSALFHSTMLHSAAHSAFVNGTARVTEFEPLRWEAVRLINERMNNREQSLSDTTVGAVVALALFENQSANVEASNVHMNGLQHMVRLRGGLQRLGLSGILRRKILWADLCNAMYAHSMPRFVDPLSTPFDFSSTEAQSQAGPSVEAGLDARWKHVVESLNSTAIALSSPFSRSRIPVDDIYRLENRVVTLLAITYPANDPANVLQPSSSTADTQSLLNNHRKIYQAALAADIYIYLFLRDHLLPSPIFVVLSGRLYDSLQSFGQPWRYHGLGQIREEVNYENETFLWVLVLAALTSNKSADRGNLCRSIVMLCNELGVASFPTLVEKLRKIAWVERKIDGELLRLWGELQALPVES